MHTRIPWSALVLPVLMLSGGRCLGQFTSVENARKASAATGRPILALAGTKT